MLGNIKFIGELYKNDILVEPVMYECISRLLDQDSKVPDEEQTEALCDLLINIGKILDTNKTKKRMNGYFIQIETLENSEEVH